MCRQVKRLRGVRRQRGLDANRSAVNVLGIETSCDETAAAVVVDGERVLSSVVASQVKLHEPFGGVVPEIACRAHLETLFPICRRALTEAELSLGDINCIAVTSEPGLIGALLVGLSAAKALAWACGSPLVVVDHLEGHAYAAKMACPELEYPYVALVASGGHTSIYVCSGPLRYRLLGRTTDDAAGEAFDKVAGMLGLGYLGGPNIEKAAARGNPKAFRFPRGSAKRKDFNFSFSGIKTAVLYTVRGQDARHRSRVLTDDETADVAASFQEAMVDMLAARTVAACASVGLDRIAIGGGVAANTRLRERFAELAAPRRIKVFFPPVSYCTDNAMMVAGIAYHKLRTGDTAGWDVDARSTAKRHPPTRGERTSTGGRD